MLYVRVTGSAAWLIKLILPVTSRPEASLAWATSPGDKPRVNLIGPAYGMFNLIDSPDPDVDGTHKLKFGADLFYTFTAPTAGDYTFNTFGSPFDTRMSVLSGHCRSVSRGDTENVPWVAHGRMRPRGSAQG